MGFHVDEDCVTGSVPSRRGSRSENSDPDCSDEESLSDNDRKEFCGPIRSKRPAGLTDCRGEIILALEILISAA